MPNLPNQPIGFNSTLSTFKPGKRQFIFLLGFVSLVLLTFLFLIGTHFERWVAVVNGVKISKADFDSRLATQTYFYTKISPLAEKELAGLKNRVLEEMIQEVLLTQLLADHGITVTNQEIRERIKQTAVDRLFGGDWKKYQNELRNKYKTTLAEVERTFRLEILREKASLLTTKKHVFAIWIAKNEPQFATYEVMKEEERQRLKKANLPKKEEAERMLKRVEKGENFTTLASQFSEDLESAKNSGDLGLLFLPTFVNQEQQPKLDSFPGKAGVMLGLKELDSGQNKLYEIFTGFVVMRVTEVKEGPFGTQSFEEWYPTFRAKADATIL